MNLSDLRCASETITVNGSRYVVTTGTGERDYGSDLGGSASFAYDADDVADLDGVESYAEFCDAISPVGEDDPNWFDLAVALACRGQRLTLAGACKPALTDREYQVARLAAEQCG